uniref:LIM/homeobox protein Lhx9 n=1 Tax=Macrostomum lignano TaxID=282301 RepID=A0A1I8IGI5_9PLAT
MLSLLSADECRTLQPDQQQPQQLFCSACGDSIRDRYFLQTGECVWHDDCLKCAACGQPLDKEARCYCRHGAAYCREDYVRMSLKQNCGLKQGTASSNAATCARCGQRIDTRELVMRVNSLVYHLSCFSCAACSRPLNTGDCFGLQDGMSQTQQFPGSALASSDTFILDTINSVGCFGGRGGGSCGSCRGSRFLQRDRAMQKGRPRRKRVEEYSVEDCDASQEDFSLSSPPRQKRMRTSFKHNQIRTMKAYFSLNHNPDAKDLKQLAEKTGLSKASP